MGEPIDHEQQADKNSVPPTTQEGVDSSETALIANSEAGAMRTVMSGVTKLPEKVMEQVMQKVQDIEREGIGFHGIRASARLEEILKRGLMAGGHMSAVFTEEGSINIEKWKELCRKWKTLPLSRIVHDWVSSRIMSRASGECQCI